MGAPTVVVRPVKSTDEAQSIVERLTGMSAYEASRCEWDPTNDEPAGAEGGCRNEATVSVGSRNNIHLCASCAALPAFSRFRKRRPL